MWEFAGLFAGRRLAKDNKQIPYTPGRKELIERRNEIRDSWSPAERLRREVGGVGRVDLAALEAVEIRRNGRSIKLEDE